MLIYKILTAEQWAQFDADGQFSGAPIDLADGYIHASTAEQAGETLDKHFSGQSGLWLAALDADDLGAALRWEVSRGGALFPHLYRDLARSEVLWCRAIADGESDRLPELT
jgi:uncharacterized protein (DUF952 family)